MLDVNAVEFRYPAGPTLRFDLRLQPGECLVVTGPVAWEKVRFCKSLPGFKLPRVAISDGLTKVCWGACPVSAVQAFYSNPTTCSIT